MKRVYISKFNGVTDMCEKIAQALEWIGGYSIVKAQSRVFIKPNLTYPFYKRGVTTSPEMIEAIVVALLNQTSNITIVESDGGGGAWTADEAFQGHNLLNIAEKYNVSLVNLSRGPLQYVEATVGEVVIGIDLPSILLNEVDVFITVPVPKLHHMTGVSLAFKNQWGCIPDRMRMRHHPEFAQKVIAVNKLLNPRMVIFDGTYFLDGLGPVEGDPVMMELLIASNDIGAGTLACCQIMGYDPHQSKHLRVALKEGLMPSSLSKCKMNTSIELYTSHKFHLTKRPLQSWAALWAFNHRFGTNLFYLWPTAKPLHKLLYLLKSRPNGFKAGY